MFSTAIGLLQTNLNHSAGAQDLLLQTMAEWSINIAVASEPYFVPPSNNWAGDTDGLVAVILSRTVGSLAFQSVEKHQGFVAACVGEVVIIGAYFSPNRRLDEFEEFVSRLSTVITRSHPRQVLVLGDLNSKSPAWGSPAADARGEILEEWLVEHGLTVLNRGTMHTCVRRNGGSIVDVTFASHGLAPRIQGWRVLDGVETLSDHRYIRFSVSAQSPRAGQADASEFGPRWALSRMDEEVLLEAAEAQAWLPIPPSPIDIDQEAEWLASAMTSVCDAAMPRVRPGGARRRQVYWWTQDIAQLRRDCAAARRQYTRHRRRRRITADSAAIEEALHAAYAASKKTLRDAIRRAKDRARQELLATLDADPWGRPYRMVRNKLRPWAPPLTQTLEPEAVEATISALFPDGANFTAPAVFRPPGSSTPAPERIIPEVTQEEMDASITRLRRKNVAPGPDGIPGRAWVLSLRALGPRLKALLSECLSQGRFPSRWKTGKLVLIAKEGRPANSPSGHRPLVLLDEVCKLFERIIADRLVEHLVRTGPDLDDRQFGFRRGRSTIDAVHRVKTMAAEAIGRREVLLAVSLDIANAFNSIPYGCITAALEYHGVPQYLRRIVGNYLTGRSVIYPGQVGWHRRDVSCGVPQGSVLGPLLWNLAYDWVLRGTLLEGVHITCYADDTLVLAKGGSHREAALLATAGVSQVVSRIRRLGLSVALQKTEAVAFCGPRNFPRPIRTSWSGEYALTSAVP